MQSFDDKFAATEFDTPTSLPLSPPPPPPPESQAMKEYAWVVARCSLVACLISFVGGMTMRNLAGDSLPFLITIFGVASYSGRFYVLATGKGCYSYLFLSR